MAERRAKRLGDEIRDQLSEIVTREMTDPRLPGILTVTEVRLTKDLRIATVFFTQLPDDEEAVAKTMKALESGKGYLQSEIASRITMRYHPELRFRHDASRQEFDRIDNILRKVRTEREVRESTIGPAEDKSVVEEIVEGDEEE